MTSQTLSGASGLRPCHSTGNEQVAVARARVILSAAQPGLGHARGLGSELVGVVTHDNVVVSRVRRFEIRNDQLIAVRQESVPILIPGVAQIARSDGFNCQVDRFAQLGR